MCIARWSTVQGAFEYMTSRMQWITSSPDSPSKEVPRIWLLSRSTRIFMKPFVSPFSYARLTSSMANQRRLAGVANLRFRHAGAAERRIGIERVGGDAVAPPPLLVIEEVGRNDLEI